VFTKKKQHMILALDEETLSQLNDVDENLTIIVELLTEAVQNLKQVRAVINGSLSEAVPFTEDVVGVQVLADEEEEPLPMPKDRAVEAHPWQPQEFQGSTVDDADRIRGNPFSRVPVRVQNDWLLRFMADGDWYSSAAIAKRLGDESRQVRYISHAIQSRFREMHNDGLLDRRSSEVRGSMYEYRLRKEG